MPTPREQLAALLRDARLDAGYRSQDALAKKMTVSRPVISRAESPTEAIPSDPVLTAWSGATGVPLDKLTDLVDQCKSGTPEWFMSYKQAEANATRLRCWAPLIVSGIAQIEPYAAEVLSADPCTLKVLGERVTVRMERQKVLNHVDATLIMDAGVLHRCMRSPQVMADQCAHLASLAAFPNIDLHVVPEHTTHGSWAAIDIASREDVVTVNFSTGTDDITTTARDQADSALRTYERILGHAMPVGASLEYIRTMEEQWKAQT